jgi:hypothetical protein
VQVAEPGSERREAKIIQRRQYEKQPFWQEGLLAKWLKLVAQATGM